MKQYKNPQGEIQTPPQFITIDGAPFEAKDEVLKSQGWTIDITEDPQPQPSAEEVFTQTKADKLAAIKDYDTSSAVNSFTYNDQTMWIDKATRVGLMNAVDCAIMLGNETVTFGIGGLSVTMQCLAAEQMLARLEMYALDCYNVTLGHTNAINAITPEGEEPDYAALTAQIEAYDHTAGYPERLAF